MWTCGFDRGLARFSDGVISFHVSIGEALFLWRLLSHLLGNTTASEFQRSSIPDWIGKEPKLVPLDIIRVDESNPNVFIIRIWQRGAGDEPEWGIIEYRITRESAEDLLSSSNSLTEDDPSEKVDDGDESDELE